MTRFIGIILVFVTCSYLGYSQTNLIQDGGFESGVKSEPWRGWNWDIKGNTVYEGAYAAQTQTGYSGNAGIYVDVILEAGKHYKLSCFVKANTGANFTISRPKEGVNETPPVRAMDINPSADWTEYSLVFSIAAGDTTKWAMGMWKPNSGKYWTDNWSLVEVNGADYNADNKISSVSTGILDTANFKITGLLKSQITAEQLLANITINNLAVAHIYSDTLQKIVSGSDTLTEDNYLVVFAENGDFQEYNFEFTSSVLLSTAYGVLDPAALSVNQVSSILSVAEFLAGLVAAEGASIEILDGTGGNPVSDQENALVTNNMVIKVTGDNEFNEYTIETILFSSEKNIVESNLAVLDEANAQLTIVEGVKVIQLLTSIIVSDYATFEIIDTSGTKVGDYADVTEAMNVRVTAQNTTTKDYSIVVTGTLEVIEWDSKKDTIDNITGKTIHITGNSELHFLGSMSDMAGSFIDIDTDSAFIFLHGIRPEDSTKHFLSSFLIKGDRLRLFDLIDHKAAMDSGEDIAPTNAMLRQYYSGTVINPYYYARNQPGVTGWSDYNFSGERTYFPVGFKRGNAALIYNGDNIKSFCLKRGFMVMMAVAEKTDKEVGQANETELGIIPYQKVSYSRIFVAAEKDYWINLEDELAGKVNYMVVMPWNWVSKKGVCTHSKFTSELDGSWWYGWWWNQSKVSFPEYVPMIKSAGMVKQNSGWDGLLYVGDVPYTETMTHFLGFNEPTGADQGDITVDEAIAAWPRLLETGARLGSPAPKEAGVAYAWLDEFMSKASQNGYRVDYVCLHWYDWGGWLSDNNPDADANQIFNRFKNFLQNKYNTYKLPLWITEFNANKNRNTNVQEEFLKLALPYLESLHYVERYAFFEPAGGNGPYFNEDTSYTALGEIYRNQASNPAIADSVFYGANNLPDGTPYVSDTTNTNSIVFHNNHANVSVYPNPVKGDLLYVNGVEQIQHVSIYSILGQRFNAQIYSGYINVGDLPKGIYILRINEDNIKFIKE